MLDRSKGSSSPSQTTWGGFPDKFHCHSRRLCDANYDVDPSVVEMLNLETEEKSKWRCRDQLII